MSDTEARKDEILALTSIFDEKVFKPEANRGGEILIHCTLSDDFHLLYRNGEEEKFAHQAGAKVEAKDGKVLTPISILPPLTLRFTFPEDYPSCSAPDFSLSCKWLSQRQMNIISQSLDNIWEDNKGEVILFLWVDYLQNEALSDLGITSELMVECDEDEQRGCHGSTEVDVPKVAEVKAATSDGETPRCDSEVAILEVLTFDLAYKRDIFSSSVFTCGICFCDAQGSDCISFVPCEHVYCKDCVTEHFSISIAEGRVHGLCCPETNCESNAMPKQVKELVDKSLFERYDTLLLQTSLDKMDDIFYCPRPGCGAAVIKDETGHLAVCSICRFVFCTLCGKANHGVFDCQKAKREMIEMMKRLKLEEARRTEEEANAMLQRELEEVAGEEYLMKFSKQCPGCAYRIQKQSGCNKMTCSRCCIYFCWICLKSLNKSDPYSHFEDPNSDCHHRLHDLIDDEEEEGWI